MSTALFDYYGANKERHLEGLLQLLRIPSISTLPEHKPDIQRAAEFLANEFREMGMKNVEIIAGKEKQHPLVYAEWLEAPGKPTLLIYGHYDVQPADPLDEWISPPFEPTIRDNNIYARGAVDDKGQVYLLAKALEGFFKTEGKLPINVKFLVEGEEEVGGEHIDEYVEANPDRLKCDAALVCDTELFAPELPTLTTGLRGLVYTELEARAAAHDLHSGMYGGAAPNPMQALAEMINKLKGPDGKILIPGFYKRVKKPTAAELASWKRLPFNEKNFMKKEIGTTALVGEKGFSVLERLWSRPTLEVHGFRGGFTGEGAKTVIPAVATAKVSMRLVPDMNPKEIIRLYKRYVKKITPKGIRTAVRILSSAPASVVSTDSRWIAAGAEALEQVFKKKTVYMRSGGSIPVVGTFQKFLKAPSVMMGFGLPDDNLHAPNEKFHIPNFYRGIETVGRFLELLGQ
ncbi:MAG: dipeptidase [Terriglobia bacterium]|jgi:acetylornithine deacetylase/succinyl-diaminopimelate desuccinylase-like protein